MSTTELRLSREDLARQGGEAYELQVRRLLGPGDEGKFVAVDVETGAFEVDEDDYAAVSRLHRRVPGAQAWLVRVGHPAAHILRRGR